MIKIFFNPKCSKCRIAKDKLETLNSGYTVCEYLTQNITMGEIEEILEKGNLEAEDILRKNEQEYKEFIEGKFLSDKEIIGLILTYPKILQRPIIVTKDSAFIARNKESLEKIC